MVSKKQKDKLKKINLGLEELQSQAGSDLGVMARSESEILSESETILARLEKSMQGKKVDLTSIPALPEGSGFDWANSRLTSRGYDTSSIRLEDLLSNEEIASIEIEVNRPLVKRLQWDRWDYILIFGAAVMGSTADFLWGDPRKGLSKYLSDKNTAVGGFFENIHALHHNRNPMDYQGLKMGGPDHRIRSIGHDLFGFLQGIWQIKNGTFTGGYFKHGRWIEIVSAINQYGTSYEKMDWDEAVWHYVVHVFCDFFSPKSLPVPGFGYLVRLPDRNIRKLAHDMYSNGYNLRHMFVQAMSVAIVELIVRVYSFLKYYRVEVPKESSILKQREMRIMAHSLVTAFNVGKVVVTKNPLALNLPQVMFTCYQFWPLVIDHHRRNNRVQMLLRNLDEISDESAARYLDSLSIPLSTEGFGQFLVQKPILL